MIIEEAKKSRLIAGQEIEGVVLKTLKENIDYRGSFTEVFNHRWNLDLNAVQWSYVKSESNVFRGLHFHKRHDEYFCIVSGHCELGLKDMRPDSPTYLNWQLYELFGDDLAALVFPRGLLHGWYFFTPSVHLQSVSESYVDYGKDDNWGVYWNDKDLGIPWSFTDPIISTRASDFPDLLSFINAIGAF
ncbi:dTDP-4-dehydrorhamnose 3,5-epimerase family protein [Algoriphagus marincola]|uniref:dTDP-4-dehydrorhamnose 3,5-epimerase n=1 Tax=Algoriphagus marincola TaxID=264027 RepID=A0ABS7N8N4_9BACT|nr:dTDP-4-dehydrorhamnose 3,5-epimerase family protein [Algoriphagus marincola]MBY5952696.1 dTDP-4-dehydrorhamnose 3,5-epimerase family protein [Algoriphagus marincola]